MQELYFLDSERIFLSSSHFEQTINFNAIITMRVITDFWKI